MLPLHDEHPTRRRAWITLALIAANVGVFVAAQWRLTAAESVEFNFQYAAIPCEIVEGRPLTFGEVSDALNGVQSCGAETTGNSAAPLFGAKFVWLAIFASMFLHGGWLHLASNMWFLWVFGDNVEDHLGRTRYLAFYVAGGVAATLAHVAIDPGSTAPIIGASGAVAAIMGAYLVWFPNARVRTLVWFGLVLFVEVSAKWLLIGWFASQFLVNNTGIAWMAHVGGFVFGAAVALIVRKSIRARQRLWRSGYAGDDQGFWNNRHGGRIDDPTPPYGLQLPPYDGPVT